MSRINFNATVRGLSTLLAVFFLSVLLITCRAGPGSEPGGRTSAASGDSEIQSIPSPEELLPLRTEGQVIKDQYGRTVQFRGVNYSTVDHLSGKYQPLSESDFEWFRKFGVNAIRIHVFWNHYYPDGESENERYRTYLRELVNQCVEQNIFVVLSFSPVDPGTYHRGNYLPARHRADGSRNADLTSSESIRAQAETFWSKTSLRKSYVRFVRKAFRHYSDTPMVIGLDLLRLPLTGTKEGPSFTADKLQKFYEHSYRSLSGMRKGKLVFLAPAGDDPLEQPDLPEMSSDMRNVVISIPRIHPLLRLRKKYTHRMADRLRELQTRLKIQARDQDRPLLFTEVGAYINMNSGREYLRDLLSGSEEAGVGWFYWLYSTSGYPTSVVSTEGNNLWPSEVLQKPVAIYVPGVLTMFSWNREPQHATIQASLQLEENREAPLELYVPFEGYSLRSVIIDRKKHRANAKWMPENNRLLVWPPADGSNTSLHVRIEFHHR